MFWMVGGVKVKVKSLQNRHWRPRRGTEV